VSSTKDNSEEDVILGEKRKATNFYSFKKSKKSIDRDLMSFQKIHDSFENYLMEAETKKKLKLGGE